MDADAQAIQLFECILPLVAEPAHRSALRDINGGDVTYYHVLPRTARRVAELLQQDTRIPPEYACLSFNSVTQVLRVRIDPPQLLLGHMAWLGDALRDMLIDRFLTVQQYGILDFPHNSAFHNFQGPWSGSISTPGISIAPTTQNNRPSVIMQSSWASTSGPLADDVDLWFYGAPETTQLVINVIWARAPDGALEGTLYVYRQNNAGGHDLVQTEVILPVPQNHESQRIPITRRQILRDDFHPFQSPNDTYYITLDRLRQWARDFGNET